MRIQFIYFYILIASLIPITTSIAADEGAHAAEFLSHGVGARALGMGSAFVAIADDATATYWNPAGLTKVKKHSFSAMYSILSAQEMAAGLAEAWLPTILSTTSIKSRISAASV